MNDNEDREEHYYIFADNEPEVIEKDIFDKNQKTEYNRGQQQVKYTLPCPYCGEVMKSSLWRWPWYTCQSCGKRKRSSKDGTAPLIFTCSIILIPLLIAWILWLLNL